MQVLITHVFKFFMGVLCFRVETTVKDNNSIEGATSGEYMWYRIDRLKKYCIVFFRYLLIPQLSDLIS